LLKLLGLPSLFAFMTVGGKDSRLAPLKIDRREVF
jgi:hypothetical protein